MGKEDIEEEDEWIILMMSINRMEELKLIRGMEVLK